MKSSLNRWFSTLGFPSTPTSGTSSGAISRDSVGGHPLCEWSGAGTNSGRRPRRLFRIQWCAGQVPTQWWRPSVSFVTLVWNNHISRWNGIILGDLITKKVGIQKINWCEVWGAFINYNWKHLLGGFFFFFNPKHSSHFEVVTMLSRLIPLEFKPQTWHAFLCFQYLYGEWQLQK